MTFAKPLSLLVCTLLLSVSAFAQNQQEKNQSSDVQINQHAKVTVSDGVTIITLPGQNTNGEDLKCAIYEAFGGNGGAGGISCNWTPAYLEKRKK